MSDGHERLKDSIVGIYSNAIEDIRKIYVDGMDKCWYCGIRLGLIAGFVAGGVLVGVLWLVNSLWGLGQ